MIFTKIPLHGCGFIVEIEKYEDFRGIFARTVCHDEFEKHGLNADFVQQSISFNPHPGTLRGMHWQVEPWAEDKLIRVTRGAIFDVVVDINPKSPTFKKWYGVELSETNRRQIYIPKGFAHGFQTTVPNTEVLYQMTTRYNLDASRGFAWDDRDINISWPPAENRIVGIRDCEYPHFNVSNQ